MKEFLPFTRPTLDEETIQGVVDVLRSGWITSGPQVERFESALADYLGGGRFVRTFSSATGALEIALVLCGIGPGDEVIVPAMSFVASANVVVRVGAKPVFVDVDLRSRNLTPETVAAAVTPRTRAIMPVHFCGLPVDMDGIYDIAREHGLRVIEDAAHAIGSRWRGRAIGAFGDIVSFSFHANKNLTTIEGGALSVSSEEDARQLEILRFHGLRKLADGSQDAVLAGGKYNMTDVSARVGLGQLARLDEFNAKRRQLAASYFEHWGNLPGVLPDRGDEGHSWHMFTPLLPFAELGIDRATLQSRLRERGIGSGSHYPAIHLFSTYRALGYHERQFPNAERIGRETITLPLFPGMETTDVDRVCRSLAAVLESN